MVSRRTVMAGAAGVLTSRTAPALAPQPETPVTFRVPPGACDCHTHIFGDPATFPLSPDRRYTPETALPSEMAELHRRLHIQRVVIVTPSVYGTDNSATLFGMKARGAAARGIAVIDAGTPDRDLDVMAKAGVRGIRLNLANAGVSDPAEGRRRFQAAAARMHRRGWHIQMYTSLAVISAIRDLVLDSPVPVVFDHFGGARAAAGLEQPGFSTLIELVTSGKAYVKISGANRTSENTPKFPDAAPLAQTLIRANPARILWGTDWPHTDNNPPADRVLGPPTPFLKIDDGLVMNQLATWAPDPVVLRKILVDNPARLYDF